jgi:S-(hydroxymethyl)glutathione dehydrogenase/alcohol dehydrogenase
VPVGVLRHLHYCLSGRTNLCGGAATARKPGEPPRISQNGAPIGQFAHLSGFAERMLVHENALVKIREDMPLEQAALIGCGAPSRRSSRRSRWSVAVAPP